MVQHRDWLQTLRIEKKLTMKVLAQTIGISESYYCLIEAGERRPSPEIAKKMATYLGFDWTRFYSSGEKTA